MTASVSRRRPRAVAICDRCGFEFNHDELRWQEQWAGPRLQNLKLLVCDSCMDTPQEQLKTFILPPDPVPIKDPRPENYEIANNPNSPIGQAPIPSLAGSNIGTLLQGGGTYAAFMGSSNKPFSFSATLSVSGSSFTNWVGKDWSAYQDTALIPTTIDSTGIAMVATAFEAVAPADAGFLASGITNYAFQGSSDASTWTTLASGATAGTAGESVSNDNLGGTAYRYHRFVLAGDGTGVGVAQLTIDTNRASETD